MDNNDIETMSTHKAALAPIVRTEGIEVVVWQERGSDLHTLSKRLREPTSYEERLKASAGKRNYKAVLDAPEDAHWARVATAAFQLQEAASGLGEVSLQFGNVRCQVAVVHDRSRTRMLVVVLRGHPTVKSLARLIRRGVRRIEKADALNAAHRVVIREDHV